MLFGILLTIWIAVCLFMILLILIQQGKGSMGMGGLGGGTQMLFGGSGGQDMFQKTTWVCGAIFMFGSLALALMYTGEHKKSRFLQSQPVAQQPVSK